MDIPDDILIKIFKYLDPITRRNLRVNQRLDKLHMCVKNNLEKINIEVCSETYALIFFYYE